MLRSDHFTANISFNLSDVFSNKFTDVTLVSDDKILFNAHRYVLGVCSPVLKNILLNNPHHHPLIYLRDVNHQELESEMKNLGCVKLLYMCEECGASFNHTKNLNQHTSSKHGGIVYSCKLCAYKAKKPDNLKQHQDSVHGGKRFSCDQCIFYINILPLDSPPLPTPT